MMLDSMLYPCSNNSRSSVTLDGLWRFQFDPQSQGEGDGWSEKLPAPMDMPVPASFADFFTDHRSRDYGGDFWYETDFFLPDDGDEREVLIRFGSVTHRCTVYVNGVEVGRHEGGFLPFVCHVSDVVKKGTLNRLSVKANNELSETTLPCGAVKTMKDGRKLVKPYFDFFNYSGIHRSVWLLRVPKTAIRDYDTAIELDGADAKVSYTVYTQGEATVHVRLLDAEGNLCAESLGSEGVLHVKNARLWEVRNAYLYQLEITLLADGQVVDTYTAPLGIRTVKIEGTKILINGKPVYLKGYGKHEDFEVLGRGFNWGVAKRDFECMKWTNANCFRTSHYPYAEEWYQFADREGFLIIDEVPAVGMKRSFFNFFDAGTGKNTHFFETPTVPELLKNHIQAVEEMIVRDKNHPSVIAFSLFNEPETTSVESRDYFTAVFEAARPLDPQHRPLTGAFEKDSSPEACLVYPLCDFICLNRYYGWYVCGGPEIDEAETQFREEMDAWAAKNLNVPFVFSEFGTDTMASEHKLPSVMWSQEYQNEYYEMNFGVFDSYDFVQGELTWNFADFQTGEGTMRVNGNKKGVFTRTRQPKESAMILKRRWEGKEN